MGKKYWYCFWLYVLCSHAAVLGLELFKSNFQRQLQSEDNSTGINNDTNVFQDVSESLNTTNNDELLWVTPGAPSTMGTVLSDVQTKQETSVETTVPYVSTEDSNPELNDSTSALEFDSTNHINISQPVISEHENLDSKMDEEIILSRKNCKLEITVTETQDLKIQIKFEPVYNKSSGICRITINGCTNSMLGVLITNVDLYQNKSEGEIIKVIVNNYGVDFVLKEYYRQNEYYPFLLTETNRVYVVLYYNITTSNENYSHFNLEVFSYYRYQNNLQYENSNSHSYSDSFGKQDTDQIFFTTETPSISNHK